MFVSIFEDKIRSCLLLSSTISLLLALIAIGAGILDNLIVYNIEPTKTWLIFWRPRLFESLVRVFAKSKQFYSIWFDFFNFLDLAISIRFFNFLDLYKFLIVLLALSSLLPLINLLLSPLNAFGANFSKDLVIFNIKVNGATILLKP